MVLSPCSRQKQAKADTVYYGGDFLWRKETVNVAFGFGTTTVLSLASTIRLRTCHHP